MNIRFNCPVCGREREVPAEWRNDEGHFKVALCECQTAEPAPVKFGNLTAEMVEEAALDNHVVYEDRWAEFVLNLLHEQETAATFTTASEEKIREVLLTLAQDGER